jgi:Protein ENHANCED DISEASE RESISTANCE 2, C-terminal
MWSCPGDAGFMVRGPDYLRDRVKVPAGPPIFDLATVDLLEVDQPVFHVARFLPSLK